MKRRAAELFILLFSFILLILPLAEIHIEDFNTGGGIVLSDLERGLAAGGLHLLHEIVHNHMHDKGQVASHSSSFVKIGNFSLQPFSVLPAEDTQITLSASIRHIPDEQLSRAHTGFKHLHQGLSPPLT